MKYTVQTVGNRLDGIVTMAHRASAKDLILDAAETVVSESGAAHLTLDAVAQKAQVSKGGLLYHYPTKEALLQGMLSRLLDRFDETKKEILAQEPPGPASEFRAHLRACFAYMKQHKRVSAAILAAGANDPRLLDPVRERMARDVAALQGSAQAIARALIVFLAVDGLWFNELLETMTLGPDVRQAVMDELLALAEPAARTGKEPA